MIKLSTIDNFLISFLMLAIISPTHIAKILVIITNFFIILRIFKDKKIFVNQKRLLVFFLITPGILLTAFYSPQDLVRFIIILLIIFKYPFNELKLNKKLIMFFSIFILFYLILTQLLLSLRIDWLISFRDIWYFHEYSHIFDHQNFLDVNEKGSLLELIGKYRLGGLFHNPNVLGLAVLLFYFIFDTCYSRLTRKNKFINLLVISITIFSLLLTFSRTAIAGFLVYNMVKHINFKSLIQFRINKSAILILIMFIPMGLYMLQYYVSAFDYRESGYLKFEVLINFLKNSNLSTLFFGGIHNLSFDAELGNWIGAVGLLGFVGLLLLLRMVLVVNKTFLPFLTALIFLSIGNTVFYGLLTAQIALIYLFIISSNNEANLKSRKQIE